MRNRHGFGHFRIYSTALAPPRVSFSQFWKALRMNLWFRLFLMLMRLPWRRPVPGLATTVVKMRVWPLDLDFNRHVTNGRYFTLADVGRMDYVLRSGAFRAALRHRAIPVVGDVCGKFRRELKLFDRFEIHTRMLGWDEKWSFVEHRFVKDERVVAKVVMRGAFRSRNGTVPPAELASELGMDELSPPLPQWLIEWSNSCDKLSIELRRAENI